MPKFSSGYGSKTTPVDNDKVLIADSEASNAIKSVSLTNFVTNHIRAKLQSLTAWIQTAMIGDGQVTDKKLKNTVRFSVSRVAAANTPNNAFAVIPFDTENYDVGNNVTNGVFTAPVTGLYSFNWFANAEGAAGRMQTRITVNGSEYRRAGDITQAGSQRFSSVGACQIPLNQNDQVRIEIYTSAPIPYVAGAPSFTYFEGSLVSLT